MQRIVLNVNDDNHVIDVESNWTLMKVIRDVLKLKGTKCGCATNDCGACKVLIDRKAVNSCSILARNCQNKKIVTIEGLARGEILHPVQKAFIDAGAIQCGFCTPGMIIAVVAFLENNPSPTEAEINMALGNNLCRCTGYIKIIEAVKRAARIMSGQDDGAFPIAAAGTSHIGSRMPLIDAMEKAKGETLYTGDLEFPHMLVGKLLLSQVAHARIKSIDTADAEKLPGVKAIAHCFNSPMVPYNSAQTFAGQQILKNETIFADKVRFVGDRVAAVAAVDEATANQALKLIKVEYEELPSVFNSEDALKPDAPVIHERGNLLAVMKSEGGDVDGKLDTAPIVMTHRIKTPRVHHGAIELHISIADYKSGKLTVWSACQNIFPFRVILGEIFGLPLNKIRVIKPPVGGGFGGKLEVILEPVAAVLAIMTGRPVRVELNRREDMISSRCRHASDITITSGLTEDGKVVVQDVRAVMDTGAYCGSAFDVTGAMMNKVTRLYDIPNFRVLGMPVYTNNQISGAMRGYGNPELMAAREIHFDLVAKKLGMDPVDFRLKNLVNPQGVNYRYNETLGDAYVKECVIKGAELFGWTEKRSRPKGHGRYRYGVGMSTGLHGAGVVHNQFDYTTISIKMNEDGTFTVLTGTHEIGQGSNTVISLLVSEVLGTNSENITIVDSDTDVVYWDNGAMASRTTWVAGNAVLKTANSLKNQILETASQILNISTRGLVLENGFAVSADSPDLKVSYGQIAQKAQAGPDSHCISATESCQSFFDPGSYIADFAEVEVDTETGAVRVVNFVAAHDIGKAINPLMVEGQIHGGIQMGLGFATCEELLIDPSSGKPLNNSFKKYIFYRAADMPKIDIVLIEKGEHHGPFGAKSIGEAATDAVAPAVVNAISDALNVEFLTLPVTPQKIMAALNTSFQDAPSQPR